MFFNKPWLYTLVVFLLVGLVTQQPALTLVALLVLLTAGLSWLWNRHALHGVFYQRRLGTTRVFRGETLMVEAELVNLKLLPLAWIRVEDELPDLVTMVDRRAGPGSTPTSISLPYLTSLRPYERVVWRSTLRCPHRGRFTIGPTTLQSGDPFGFFRSGGRVRRQDAFIVYPKILPLSDLGIPPRQAFGELRAPQALLVDPLRPVGVREYRPEDSFRHIHWKATARAQELQVRVFEPTTVIQLAIFVNLDSSGQSWLGLDAPQFETVIDVAASLAAYAADGRYAFGVYSNRFVAGSNRMLRVAPDRGPAQLGRVLEDLAKLSPFVNRDFPRYLRDEGRDLPWGSTVVVVTAIMTPELAATLEALRAAGYRLVLVATEPIVPPPVRGVVVHQLLTATRRGQAMQGGQRVAGGGR